MNNNYPNYEIERFEDEGGSCYIPSTESEIKMEKIPVIGLLEEDDNDAGEEIQKHQES